MITHGLPGSTWGSQKERLSASFVVRASRLRSWAPAFRAAGTAAPQSIYRSRKVIRPLVRS